METIGDAPDTRRARSNLCARCQWGRGGSCDWGFPEYAQGGWRKDEHPHVHWTACGTFSAPEDDPATR